MGAADAEGASALEAACFEGAGHEAWTPGMFLSELGEDVAAPRSWWVAHDDGKLLGLAGGMVVDGDVQILDVAVDSAHRREGIARKLLSHVSYDAQMLGCTTLRSRSRTATRARLRSMPLWALPRWVVVVATTVSAKTPSS